MTPIDITAVAAACSAATPGPWRVYQCGDSNPEDACGIKHEPFVSDREDAYQRGVAFDTNRDECHHMMSTADAAFIALARTALPDAIAEIQRLRALVEEAATMLADYIAHNRDNVERVIAIAEDDDIVTKGEAALARLEQDEATLARIRTAGGGGVE